MEFGLEEKWKTTDTSIRIAIALVGAQTKHLLNISQESDCYMKMLDPQKRIVSVALAGIMKGVFFLSSLIQFSQ
jgi:hypothetical protein